MSELSWAGACSWRVSHILPTSLLPLLFLGGEGKIWFLLRRALAGDPEPLTIWRNIFIQTSGSISGTARFLLCSPLLRCSCSRLFSSPFPDRLPTFGMILLQTKANFSLLTPSMLLWGWVLTQNLAATGTCGSSTVPQLDLYPVCGTGEQDKSLLPSWRQGG